MRYHNIFKKSYFTIFKLAYLLYAVQSLLFKTKQLFKFLSNWSITFNFCAQIFIFCVLLLSGDIETNPGPSAENSLDIMHINIRSIRNKIDSLLYLVQDFDVLCFTETHLDVNISNDSLNIEGYKTSFRKDRNSYGGGVMIYISDSIVDF